jgi:hypothetical protein
MHVCELTKLVRAASTAGGEADTDEVFVPCEQRQLGPGPCVDVLFAWAPRFVDHVEMTQVCVCPTRNLLKGTVTLGDPQ